MTRPPIELSWPAKKTFVDYNRSWVREKLYTHEKNIIFQSYKVLCCLLYHPRMLTMMKKIWRCVLSAEWGSWGYFESNWTDKYKIQQIKWQIQNTTNKDIKIFRFGLSGFMWLWDLKKWKQVLGKVPFLFLNTLPKEKFVRWSSLIWKSSQKIVFCHLFAFFMNLLTSSRVYKDFYKRADSWKGFKNTTTRVRTWRSRFIKGCRLCLPWEDITHCSATSQIFVGWTQFI